MNTNPPALPPLSFRQVRRSAGSTIAGYQYQFERSVVELLGLESGHKLRIEGVEDIDIWTESPSVVQVKYFEAQKWSLPAVRDAVHELLNSFASGLIVTYVLYIHCGIGNSPPERLSLDELKQCLTKSAGKKHPQELIYKNFDEGDLRAFIDHFEIRCGPSLEEQRHITASAISAALQCSEDEAEALHRMRAVQFLHEIATNKDGNQRDLTRDDLLKRLSDREVFYNRWHKEVVGRDRFISAISKKLKTTGLNRSSIDRGVLLQVTDENLTSVCRLAAELAQDMDGTAKRRTTSAKPWTLVLRGDDHLVTVVKRSLIETGVPFNDGFETLQFSPDLFIKPVIVNGSGKTDRLIKASYLIRIVNEKSIERILETGYKLAQLIVLTDLDNWHTELVRDKPIQLREVDVDEIIQILRGITT